MARDSQQAGMKVVDYQNTRREEPIYTEAAPELSKHVAHSTTRAHSPQWFGP